MQDSNYFNLAIAPILRSMPQQKLRVLAELQVRRGGGGGGGGGVSLPRRGGGVGGDSDSRGPAVAAAALVLINSNSGSIRVYIHTAWSSSLARVGVSQVALSLFIYWGGGVKYGTLGVCGGLRQPCSITVTVPCTAAEA